MIADTQTAIPGGQGTFARLAGDLSAGPSIAVNGAIAFDGYGNDGQVGIYQHHGDSLSVVADTSTPIPGSTGTFTGFGSVSADHHTLTFRGFGPGSYVGLFQRTSPSSPITTVVETGTVLPKSNGTSSIVGTITAPYNPQEFGVTLFCAADAVSGIPSEYTFDGSTYAVVADEFTLIPGGVGSFERVDAFGANMGGVILFSGRGANGQAGIYKLENGALSVLVDTSTPIPGGTGTFEIVTVIPGFVNAAFGAIGFNGDVMSFVGYGANGQRGVYTLDLSTSSLAVIADTSTVLPGGSPTQIFTAFEHFAGASVGSNGTVVLAGGVEGQVSGLYMQPPGGSLTKIVATGDVVDGKNVVYALASTGAQRANRLAAYLQFSGGSEGIYEINLP
ncbi:MAG: hypothetical protein HC923_00925 [Myxococcales bacterium]|nr:hypothetical protein [Myxococcales bacterium]